jgi:hypothetical protein
MASKKKGRKKTINRYNIFQKELSEYVRESGGSKSDFKKYRSLYKEIAKDVSPKAFRSIIPALITTKAEPKKELNYSSSIPFYNAKGEFSLPKYSGVTLKVKFNDGGVNLDWGGSPSEFLSWFSGDIISYFRNNYNDSPVAEFVLKDGNEQSAEYEIQVEGSLVGTKGYVPAGSDFLSKSSLPEKGSQVPSEDTERLKLRESILNKEMELIDKKLKLIEKLEGLGFSKEEIREQLKRI